MDRRTFIGVAGCSTLCSVLANEETSRPRHKISASSLHKALSARFPVRAGVRGLVELELSAPRLLLLPAKNKLGAGLQAQVRGGAQLRREESGEIDLAFAVRYERADQTLRALRPEVVDMRWPGLRPEGVRVLQSLLSSAAVDIGEVVLHRFTASELALPQTMGFEPEEIRVVDDGLVVHFGPKRG